MVNLYAYFQRSAERRPRFCIHLALAEAGFSTVKDHLHHHSQLPGRANFCRETGRQHLECELGDGYHLLDIEIHEGAVECSSGARISQLSR